MSVSRGSVMVERKPSSTVTNMGLGLYDGSDHSVSRAGSIVAANSVNSAFRDQSYQRHRLPRSATAEHLARALGHAESPPSSPRAQSLQFSAISEKVYHPRPYFRSRRIKKGEIDRPELRERDPRQFWVNFIPLLGFAVGFTSIALLVWDGWRSVSNHKYCPVFVDDFSNGFNSTIWTHEVETGGYGSGDFEITTTSDENVFVRDGQLIIKPTVQTLDYLNSTALVNLTASGTCTSDVSTDCVLAANSSGDAIVMPTKSGRINTKNFAVIRYGRVEVEAKMAAGDWLLSSILMEAAEDYYGAWPASGEIDIAQVRGNNFSYAGGGNNIVQGALHWGPAPTEDRWQLSSNKRAALHSTYADDFHTFGLEWSEKYLFVYVDSRLAQIFYATFNMPFFQRGGYAATYPNGSLLYDPWSGRNTSDATPFDRPFFLTLAVSVGGTSGWFSDGMQGKPWADTSTTPRTDFWNARGQWLPTWEQDGHGELIVRKVSMWQQCDNGAQFLSN